MKEFRLAEVSIIEAGNAFLPGFMERFNERFALRPVKTQDLHRTLNVPASRLKDILCHCEQRYVGAQLHFHYDRRQIILDRSQLSEGLAGQYVDLYDFGDGRLEVRFKGRVLPYRTFHKDQRVNAAATVENKRLGHALTIIKAQQDLKSQPKVKTNSEKTGYKKTPRQLFVPDYKAEIAAAPTVEMTA